MERRDHGARQRHAVERDHRTVGGERQQALESSGRGIPQGQDPGKLMGTSGSYGGAGNRSPLIPSFLNDPAPASAPVLPGPSAPPALGPTVPGPLAPGNPTPGPSSPRPATSPSSPGSGSPPVQAPLPNRFTSPRTNFSRFARSGGRDRASLGRALAGYVSAAAGGSRQATRRMGASRGAG